ncbi:hypothetical protein [Sinomonas sp. P47F7]|uniref:hypothetical protein n=1 Tax=Sinomonas sp. P47F7 TaxID=3410987 RepID=UPI003BF60F76
MELLTRAGKREAPRTALVLLEGVSDVAAVRVLASARGVDPQRIDLVDMGGVTNVRHALTEATRRRPEADVVGLCDAGEAHFVIKALRAVGYPVRDASDLPAYGFFVCQSDLEDELIRALGTARTMAVVEKLGLSAKLATLRQQPAWQGRPLAHQLHRFCGVASGRKELLAGELAAALAPGEEPGPLRMLVERMPQGLATPSTAGEGP